MLTWLGYIEPVLGYLRDFLLNPKIFVFIGLYLTIFVFRVFGSILIWRHDV